VYRYNGKELDEATGLYDYGFRWYDPSIGRFTGVDPIADQFAFVSSYNYAENEPVNNRDLWGLQKGGNLFEQAAELFGISYGPAGTKGDNSPKTPQQANRQADNRTAVEPLLFGAESFFEGASYTDANDLYVLYTAAQGNARNINGVEVGTGGVIVAGIGIFLPYISGSGAGKALRVADEYRGKTQGGVKQAITVKDGHVLIDGQPANFDGDFVITKSGEFRIGIGHYHLSDSADEVLNAGKVGITNGKVEYLDNWSGHYRPGAEKLLEAANTLGKSNLTSKNLRIYDFIHCRTQKVRQKVH
jgi:RHS repeat-associated protein